MRNLVKSAHCDHGPGRDGELDYNGACGFTVLCTAYFVAGDYRRVDEFFERILQLLTGDRFRERCGLAGFPAAMSRFFWALALAERGEFRSGDERGTRGDPSRRGARPSLQPHLRTARPGPRSQGQRGPRPCDSSDRAGRRSGPRSTPAPGSGRSIRRSGLSRVLSGRAAEASRCSKTP